ncbi:WXG100 family type VII secretion target [Streptomyces sp. NPDC057426]|uniref:WXG100 family type VII secretion target n=1 Tax=Streptomyces sp. NPDC057426 TaxID=3346128 RepID=UPI0036B68083
MSEPIAQNFEGMRAGISAVINCWEGVEAILKKADTDAETMLASWEGSSAVAFRNLFEEWKRVMYLANERLKDLDEVLKDVLDEQVAKEGDRAQLMKQLEFNKQLG